MKTDKQLVSGTSVRALGMGPLVTGSGAYAADIHVGGAASLRVVRSTVAHGKLRGVEAEAARRMPGVVCIWSAQEIIEDLGRVPVMRPRVSHDLDIIPYLQPVLAFERIRYVGEPVAIVVAENEALARDAAELVEVDADPLAAVLNMDTAAGSRSLFEGGDLVKTLRADYGGPDRAFERAAIVVEAELVVGRHSGVPMEPRALTVDYDQSLDLLTIYGATKVPHTNRRQLAEYLDLDVERVRMVETRVGGGFGIRGEFYPEDFLVPWAARRLRRPVQWTEDRHEHMVAANHSRHQLHRAAIAGDGNGRILGLRSEFWMDCGAYVRTVGLRVADLTLAELPGPYDIRAYSGVAHCVVSNRTPTGTYRSPGRFESTFVRERLIDIYAGKIGISPEEVRRINLIRADQLPYHRPISSTGAPVIFDDADFPKLMDTVLQTLDMPAVRARAAGGETVGVGVATFLEKSGLGPWEHASVEITRTGSVLIRTGATELGQGLSTVLAQVAADDLEVDLDAVSVMPVDTVSISKGIGTYASRSTVTAGSSVHLACLALTKAAVEFGRAYFEVDQENVRYRAGGVELKEKPDVRLTLGEVAQMIGTLKQESEFQAERVCYCFGVHAAVVRVDVESREAIVERLVLGYDIGRALNPQLVEDQLRGGAIQGLGGALMEEFVYDLEGNPQASSFVDYLIPSITEAPSITVVLSSDHPARTNPLGVKGCGEAGIPGIAPAIAAAIEDAVGLSGVILRTPITPDLLHTIIGAIG